jgi:serine/threonine protein phosphatase PrpC
MYKSLIEVGASCEKGVFKDVNQDNILVKTKYHKDKVLGLFCVADGVGGLDYGEIASGLAVEYLDEWWNSELDNILEKEEDMQFNIISQELSKLFKLANQDIINYGNSISIKAGTTLSVLFIYNDNYLVKHIGDSRIYLLSKPFKKLTMDHSWVDEQIMLGNLAKEEAINHPKKNVLTQCLGLTEDIRIFEFNGSINKKDCFLLATDGLYNQFGEKELMMEASKIKNYKIDVQQKVDEILEKAISRGDKDNLSLIVLRYKKHMKVIGKIKEFFSNLFNKTKTNK